MPEADDGGSGGEDQLEPDDTPIPDRSVRAVVGPAPQTAFAGMLTEPLAKASPAQRRYVDQLMAAAIAADGSGREFGRAEVAEPAGPENDEPRAADPA